MIHETPDEQKRAAKRVIRITKLVNEEEGWTQLQNPSEFTRGYETLVVAATFGVEGEGPYETRQVNLCYQRKRPLPKRRTNDDGSLESIEALPILFAKCPNGEMVTLKYMVLGNREGWYDHAHKLYQDADIEWFRTIWNV